MTSTELIVGYPAALDDLHARVAPGGLVANRGGQVIASLGALPQAAPTHLARWGLAVGTAAGQPERVLDEFGTGLLRLHRHLLHRALREAMDHLGGRTSGGASLLSRQLLQEQCARIAMRLSEDAAVPEDVLRVDPQARWRLHRRLVRTGRAILRLYGASGYLADGPAADLHLAEVTGQTYLLPGDDDD